MRQVFDKSITPLANISRLLYHKSGQSGAKETLRALILLLLILFLGPNSVHGQSTLTSAWPIAVTLPADRIVRISSFMVEFEHHGTLAISPKVECYHHYGNEYRSIPLAGVLVGLKEVTATVSNGEVVCFDVYDSLYLRTMQVAISTNQFRSIEHKQLEFSSTCNLFVEEKGTGRGFVVPAGGRIFVSVQNGGLQVLDDRGIVWVFGRRLYLWAEHNGLTEIPSLQRGTSTGFTPCYRGRFELALVDDEHFLAINEISLEEYLYQVVPSEMPISWPFEALKAQAVAARTFAVSQVIYSRQGHLGFHVSDSTDSQVYNNHPEAEITNRAIRETEGQILVKDDGTIGAAYFYSSSPRLRLDNAANWRDVEQLGLEGNSPWYRWQCSFTIAELNSLLPQSLIKSTGSIRGVEVKERDSTGRVTVLEIQGEKGKEVVRGELEIRRTLRPAVLRRVHDALANPGLLPSAHFFVEMAYGVGDQLQSITLYGGGSGHGLGMSQWGAKGMAESGFDYQAILEKYYSGTKLITNYEQLRY